MSPRDLSPAPKPVIPLDYAHSRDDGPRDQVAWRLAIINWACILTAWVALLARVESVLISAPILALLGITLIWVGGIRQFWLMIIGVCNCAVCALFVALVNLWNWGPDTAYAPFSIMGFLYVVLIGMLTLYSNFNSPNLPG